MRVLFLCSQNRLRSPTAERVFSVWSHIEVRSAGLDTDAIKTVTPDDVSWADLIVTMDKSHYNKVSKKFKALLAGKKVVCLGIHDEYEFMDPGLIRLLKMRMSRYFDGRV